MFKGVYPGTLLTLVNVVDEPNHLLHFLLISLYRFFIYLKTLFYNTLCYMSYTDEEQASEY